MNFLFFLNISFNSLTVQWKAVSENPWKSSPKMLKNSTKSQINQLSLKKWTNNLNHVFLSTWQVGKKKWLYHCTEVRSTEFISKQPCQFFCATFLFTPVQIQCPTLWTECAWYLHSLLTILPIYLLPVICFKLPITRTFFNFPGRFLLSGVGCTLLLDLLTICTYSLLETIGILLWCLSYCLQ